MRTQLTGRFVLGIAAALALAACTPDAATRSPLTPGEAARDREGGQSGSQSVTVPHTIGNKNFCFNGQCTPIPGGSGGTLTLGYSNNYSATDPTFSVGSCPGGVAIYVSGVSVGAEVQASFTNTFDPSKNQTPPAQPVNPQTPPINTSLCDA